MTRHRLYIITSPSGRQYVGMTVSPIETRWQGHISSALGCYRHLAPAGGIGAEIQRLGPESFTVEQVASAPDEASARLVERQLILQYKTLAPGGMNYRLAREPAPPECLPKPERDWLWVGPLARKMARAA